MYNWKLPHVNSTLNGCIVFNWNSDVLCFFKMKTWRVQYDFENVFFSIPNPTRCKSFKSKFDAYWNFQFKIMLLKKHQKSKKTRFRGVKWTKSDFLHANFFQNLTCRTFFNSKSNALYFFQSKIWRFVKPSNQNLTRLESFISKSDALEKMNSKSEKFKNSFLRNVSFISFFKFWLKEDIFCQR